MKIRLSHIAAASCTACLAWWLLNPGAASGQAPAQLAAMDYIQIQQLVNRLNFALDYCGNGGQTFAELFVAGGRYVIDRGDGQPVVRNTRDALIALAGGPGCESRRTAPSSYILHLAESLVIEATADGARGTSYAFYPSSAGRHLNDETAGQLGFYHDEYVRTANGWRLRSRRHELNPAVGGVTP